MVIHISEKYRVVSDPMNWAVQEVNIAGDDAKEPGKKSWNNIAYFRDFRQCVEHIHHLNVSLVKGSSAEKILHAITDSEQTILTALEQVRVTR